MLSAAELKRMAGKEGIPQATIEKDYALSLALAAISESSLAKHLVFKGGTAIRKMYFPEARFSEDLDFSANGLGEPGILSDLKKALGGRTIDDISFGEIEKEKTSAGLKVAIKFTGQLVHPQRIRFDFSFRDNLVEKAVEKEILDAYGSGKHMLRVLTIEEIFAEKIHALCSRVAPRDLYDVWFLLGKGLRPNEGIIEKKFAYYGETYEKEKFVQNVWKSREGWKQGLERLVKTLPQFEEIANEVINKL